MSTILVTGATGHLGGAVVNELLKKISPDNIHVLVRDTAKAADLAAKGITVKAGDYNDYASLVAAFEGVHKLYFVSGSDVINRSAQHEQVVKAAIAAKVEHIFYTSFQRRTEDDTSPIALVAAAHMLTEKLIKASGITYTILKHTLYTEVLPMFMGNNVVETGTIFLPAGNGKVAYATRGDMAAAAAVLLTGAGHENKAYEIAGDTTYSLGDVAAILSELSGKTIQYISPAPADFIQQLTQAGVPPEAVQAMAAFCAAIEQGEFDAPVTTLKELLGRKPVDVKSFLKTTYYL